VDLSQHRETIKCRLQDEQPLLQSCTWWYAAYEHQLSHLFDQQSSNGNGSEAHLVHHQPACCCPGPRALSAYVLCKFLNADAYPIPLVEVQQSNDSQDASPYPQLPRTDPCLNPKVISSTAFHHFLSSLDIQETST